MCSLCLLYLNSLSCKVLLRKIFFFLQNLQIIRLGTFQLLLVACKNSCLAANKFLNYRVLSFINFEEKQGKLGFFRIVCISDYYEFLIILIFSFTK